METTLLQKIELDFDKLEFGAFKFAKEAATVTAALDKAAGNATVEEIEAMIPGGTRDAATAKALIDDGNKAIQVLLSANNLDAVKGTLLMLGAKLTALFHGNKATTGSYIILFQKVWDLLK